ncbi:MAG: 6-bladed beta-propeller [Candidatus Tectimicrobiota bacterium]
MSSQQLYRYSHTIGFYAQFGRGFNNPVDLAVRRDGLCYVLNRAGSDVSVRMGYKRVTMCNIAEEYYGDFSSGGTAEGQIMWPVAIALDAADNVYISDEALQRISIFDKDGRFLACWGKRGQGEGEFDRPAGLAFTRDQHLLVVDGRNNRVQKYTRDGTFLGAWGRTGSGPGEFNLPWGIAVDQADRVYVADWRNDRIQQFAADGTFLASWGCSGEANGQFSRPSGVAVDQAGYMHVADWGNERVQILAPDGQVQLILRGESGLSKWGASYFTANQDELAERLSADLEPPLEPPPTDMKRYASASIEKLFWGPVAVKIDEAGRLYVVESCRHRIQIYCRA